MRRDHCYRTNKTRKTLQAASRAVAEQMEQRVLLSYVPFTAQPPIATSSFFGGAPILTADIDADGHTDIISGSSSAGLVWYANSAGNGSSFTAHTIAQSGGARAVADVDGDGDIDIISAAGAGLAWYENTAHGASFTAHTVSDDLVGARSLVAADLDGDGDMDVVSSSYGSGVRWYENDGTPATGGWAPHTVGSGAGDIAAADVDGDGDTDVAAGGSGYSTGLWWLENDGTPAEGSWTRHTISSNYSARVLSAADVDGDGDVDFVTTTSFNRAVAWLENTAGNGSAFTPHLVSSPTLYHQSLTTADMDGDGDVDVLAAASSATSAFVWYENDGSPAVGTWSSHNVASGYGAIAAGDIDGDGDTDVVSATGFELSWNENTAGNGSAFTSHQMATVARVVGSVIPADLDGDGDTDVVSSTSYSNRTMWYENTGGASAFAPHLITTMADAQFAADMDGDGDLDLVAGHGRYGVGTGNLSWYENDGTPATGPWTMHLIATDSKGVFIPADIDGDGDTDVVVALRSSYLANYVTWYENSGHGTAFTAHSISTSGSLSIAAADVDGDGDTDVIAALETGTVWFDNTTGNGLTFTPHTISTTPVSVFAGVDLDKDGDTDLISFGSWYENDGTPAVGQWTAHAIGDGSPVVPADLDADGDTDLVTFISPRTILWYENDGTPAVGDWTGRSITTNAVISGYYGLGGLATADLDHDGDIDVLSSGDGGDLAWYRNETIHRSNAAPTIHNIASDTDKDETLYFRPAEFDAGFSDADGDRLYRVQILSLPAHGTLTATAYPSHSVVAGDELERIDLENLSYTPDAGYLGPDSFTFKSSDGIVYAVSSASVNISVHPPRIHFTAQPALAAGVDSGLSVIAADIDHDGDQDLVAGLSTRIDWYQNDGHGNFTAHSVAQTSGAAHLFAADIDGDGSVDVLAGAYYGGLTWYANTAGNGSVFAAHLIDAAVPYSVSAADIDGDGDMDVLAGVGGVDRSGVTWHENTGHGSAFVTHLIASAFQVTSIAAADIDADGDMDVLSASAFGNTVTWYENTSGNGSSFTAHLVATSYYPTASVADVNEDGRIDVIVGFSDGFVWYENDGTPAVGAWTAHDIVGPNTLYSVSSISAADFDRDGDTDLLARPYFDVLTASYYALEWYENTDGNGTTFTAHTIDIDTGAQAATPADLDGDGDLDVASTSYNKDDVVGWYENTAANASAFTQHVILAVPGPGLAVATGDVNGDGFLDVVAVEGQHLVWHENTAGDGSNFTRHVVADNVEVRYSAMALADIDGDGGLDIALGGYQFRLSWYENTNHGASFIEHRIADNRNTMGISIADMDGDGDRDIVVVDRGRGLSWFENRSHGADFTTNHQISTLDIRDYFGQAVTTADMDNDGDMDVIGGSYFGGAYIFYYENTNHGASFARHFVAFAGNEHSVVAADVDGDGDTDIMTQAGYGASLAWFENAGPLSPFTRHTIDAHVANRIVSMSVADIDGDGDPDLLIAANGYQNTIDLAWYENVGHGSTFAPHTLERSGSEVGVAAGDIDGDGDMDVLSAGYTDGIRWFRNDNLRPTITGIPAIQVGEDAPNTILTLSSYFHDPEAQTLVYTIRSVTGTAGLFSFIGISGEQLTLDYAHNASGSATITIRATDPLGGYVDSTFTVTVLSASQLVQLLGQKVRALSGLGGGNINALLAKLDLKGNGGDTGKVKGFIDQINVFIKTGKLTRPQADPLLLLAGFLLDALK